MTERYAHQERLALADTLLDAGPDAPTLCEGWATRDLAAHLVLRERRPDAAAGILIGPLAGHTKRVQDDLAKGDYTELVDKVRRPQRISLLQIDAVEEAMNLVEFFVHHEDVRRATPGWTARELSEGYERALLGRVRATARLSARRFPGEIVAQAPGAEPFRAGAGGERVEVRGTPGDLLLFFSGRQRATNVEVTGPQELAARLRGASLGL
jgi:uncharacterized protein (TIGR03085 family)